jgi:hypothetical protein
MTDEKIPQGTRLYRTCSHIVLICTPRGLLFNDETNLTLPPILNCSSTKLSLTDSHDASIHLSLVHRHRSRSRRTKLHLPTRPAMLGIPATMAPAQPNPRRPSAPNHPLGSAMLQELAQLQQRHLRVSAKHLQQQSRPYISLRANILAELGSVRHIRLLSAIQQSCRDIISDMFPGYTGNILCRCTGSIAHLRHATICKKTPHTPQYQKYGP